MALDPGSFRDPDSRVYVAGDGVYRLLSERGRDIGLEVAPGADLAAERVGLSPIWVVQPEHGCLSQRVGRPEARRMLWITFDFGRPPHVALDEDRLGNAGERNRGREEQRTAGDELFGLAHVGDDRLRRLLRAGADAGKRQ